MWLTKNLNRLRRCTWQERLLLLESLAWLGLMRSAVLLLPFRWIVVFMGLVQRDDISALVDHAGRDKSVLIGWAVRAAAARTPWQSACLVQALACSALLRRRSIPCTLYLGVFRDIAEGEKLSAHAWLRCGDHILTGEGGHERFSVISSFTAREQQ